MPTTTVSAHTSAHSPNQAHTTTTTKATLSLANLANTQRPTHRQALRYSRTSPALYPCPIWAPTPADCLSPVGRPWAIADRKSPSLRFRRSG